MRHAPTKRSTAKGRPFHQLFIIHQRSDFIIHYSFKIRSASNEWQKKRLLRKRILLGTRNGNLLRSARFHGVDRRSNVANSILLRFACRGEFVLLREQKSTPFSVLGTRSENRTHNYPLGGGYYIHLTMQSYFIEEESKYLFIIPYTLEKSKYFRRKNVLENLFLQFDPFFEHQQADFFKGDRYFTIAFFVSLDLFHFGHLALCHNQPVVNALFFHKLVV